MKVSVIIACAGKGSRAGLGKNKILHSLDGENCLQKCLSAFEKAKVDQIIVTSSQEDYDEILDICKNRAIVVIGGETRTQSIKNALEKVETQIVLIHDGARPYLTQQIITDCISGAQQFGGVITAIPSVNTIVSCKDSLVEGYLGKDGLYSVQTPQAFKTDLIKKAYELAGDKIFNDDGEVYKTYIAPLRVVNGDSKNVKLTFNQDFYANNQVRFGTGFDCHRLVENRKLILGGVEIPHSKGLLGHSDADVLTHAVMDAILSACALGDIGKLFPDTDMKYKDADSIKLLQRVLALISEQGFKVDSISATIMAEKPKLKNYIDIIRKNLASTIGIDIEKIGIGATTLEGLGFIGREEGICVNATAVVIKNN